MGTKDVNVKFSWVEKFDSINVVASLTTSERRDGSQLDWVQNSYITIIYLML